MEEVSISWLTRHEQARLWLRPLAVNAKTGLYHHLARALNLTTRAATR